MENKNNMKKSIAAIFSLLIISMAFNFAFLTSISFANADGGEKADDSFWTDMKKDLQEKGVLECFPVNKDGIDASKPKKIKGFKALLCIYEAVLLGISAAQAIERTAAAGSAFPEQQLAGTSMCESCNIPYTECTKERCSILGACNWIEKENKRGGVCISGVCEPTGYPLIEGMTAKFYIDKTELFKSCLSPNSNDCTQSSEGNGKQINMTSNMSYRVSDVDVNITLNQKAKCKYIIDSTGKNFSDMPNEFDNNEFYPEAQSVNIDLSKLELEKEHTIYICLLYTSPSPRDRTRSRMPSSA